MDWLKQALAKVYGEDGLLGIVVVVSLIAALWWLFGEQVMVMLGN